MAKRNNTVTAPSIVAAFIFAVLVDATDSFFSISSTIAPIFSDLVFSILFVICIIILCMPGIRKHRPKAFNWKMFLLYAIPGLFVLLFAHYLGEAALYNIFTQSQGLVFNSLTPNRLIAAIIIGVGMVKSINSGTMKRREVVSI